MNNTLPFLLCGALILLQCPASCSTDKQASGRDLPPCPASPNCVSSLEPAGARHVEPFPYRETQAEARAQLIDTILSMPRAKMVVAEGNYLQVEFRSALFHFVDNVEFLFDGGNKVIHVRSASRVGYYDFGVNRRRVEELRKRFMAVGTSNG
jgi:uncharacterized protein (DUF1499 family)